MVDVCENFDEKQLKTPSYTLKAIKKYQEKNKERLQEYAREKYKEKYADPDFREKERIRKKELYHKKKLKEQETLNSN
jgi:hypothetical protein